MKRRVIYPGTFDPVTNGHVDIIKRACSIFGDVIVAVSASRDKNPMFNLEDRLKMMELATKKVDGVVIKTFDSLLVDFADDLNTDLIIRGLRAVSDFEYELQMAYANRSLNPKIDTVALMPSLEHAFVSSSIVRSILKHSGDYSHLLPPEVYKFIMQQLN